MEHIEVRLIALYRDGGTTVYQDRERNIYYKYGGFGYGDKYPNGTILNVYPKSGELGLVKVLNVILHQVCQYGEPWPTPKTYNDVQSKSNSSESKHPWPEDHNFSYYVSTFHTSRIKHT